MDTRFLDSFLTVVDSGSIAEAARRLNLTPAAVALRIRTIEAEVGASLIARSGRSVKLTEAGAAILPRARKVLGDVRDLKSIASNETPSGELRLGTVQTVLAGLLPDILRRMRERYPQIEVHIARGGSGELYPRVLSGELDAAIIARPPFSMPKACNWHELRSEPLIVLTPASMTTRDAHSVLRAEPFIRLERKSWAGQLVDGYLRSVGIRPSERFELDSPEAIAALVDKELGVSLLPDWAPPWPEGLRLRKLPIRGAAFARRVGLIWIRASLRLRLVQAFLEVAVAVPTAPMALTRGPKKQRPP
jgi:DNA-binding transcriptional LysR family regulator